jgi:molecular chaperone GrpE (heat shock protein)
LTPGPSTDAAESDEQPEDRALHYEGMEAIHRLFLNALRGAGAEPVDSVGYAFGPKVHEAVGIEARDGFEPGTVVQEVRHGQR